VLAGRGRIAGCGQRPIELTRNPHRPPLLTGAAMKRSRTKPAETRLSCPRGATYFGERTGIRRIHNTRPTGAGENREVGFTLDRERPAAPPPPVASGMAEFENAQSWKKDGDNWVHKGADLWPISCRPRVSSPSRWNCSRAAEYSGQARSAGASSISTPRTTIPASTRWIGKTFWAGVIQKGQRLERVKAPLNLGNQKAFTIQIEVTPDRLVQKVRVGDEWKALDTFVEQGRDFTQGKFGF